MYYSGHCTRGFTFAISLTPLAFLKCRCKYSSKIHSNLCFHRGPSVLLQAILVFLQNLGSLEWPHLQPFVRVASLLCQIFCSLKPDLTLTTMEVVLQIVLYFLKTIKTDINLMNRETELCQDGKERGKEWYLKIEALFRFSIQFKVDLDGESV